MTALAAEYAQNGVSVVTGILLLSPQTYLNFIKSARYAAAQLANFFFARTVGSFDEGFAGQPLLHTWSLGVEEQFYLFWPLLIVFFFLATDWMRRGSAACWTRPFRWPG